MLRLGGVLLLALSTHHLGVAPAQALSAQTNLQSALQQHKQGQLREAIPLYEAVVDELGAASTPSVVLSNLGAAYLAQERSCNSSTAGPHARTITAKTTLQQRHTSSVSS